MRFLPRGRTLFAALGRNLSHHLGCVVVIPDISTYPSGGRLPQQIEDTRLVLQWVADNASFYGGDGTKVFLCGHGLSGLLAFLVPIQQGVVRARDMGSLSVWFGEDQEVPNGIKDLRIYASDVIVPNVVGVIAYVFREVTEPNLCSLKCAPRFSPITNVDRHILHESRQGIHNISLVRRVCGPTQKISLQHSVSRLVP